MLSEGIEAYRLLARDFPRGSICLFDRDLRYLVADGDLIRQSPFGSIDFIGKTAVEVCGAETAASWLPSIERALAGEEHTFEIVQGGYVIHNVVRPVRGPDGSIAGVLLLSIDITAQHAAEEKVAASERRFRALFEHSGDGITLIDARAHVLFQTPSASRIWGRTGDEPGSSDPFHSVHPDDKPAAQELLGALLAHPGATVSFRCRIQHGDGSWRWCDTVTTNLLHEPDVGAIVVNHRDVHDRVRAEEALRLLAEGTAGSVGRDFFRALVHGLTTELGLRWALAAELVDDGRRLSAVAGSGDVVLESVSYDVVGTPCEPVAAGAEAHHPEGLRLRFPDLATLEALGPVESHFAVPLLGDGGKVLGLIAVLDDKPLRDVTHLRSILRVFAARAAAELVRLRAQEALERSEDLNRRLLAAVPAGIVRVALDGSLRDANAMAQRVLGLDLDQASRRLVADFSTETIWEDGTPCPVEAYPVSRCLATGEPAGPLTLGVRRPDGNIAWGIFSAHPLYDPRTGARDGAVVTILDITERKQLEDQLRHSQKMDAIGKLAGGVAHDFNNLLTVILGRSELLLERLPAGDRTRDDITLFHRTATRAAGLTRQLLAISRQQVADAAVLDLNRVVAHMVDLLRGLIGERIELVTTLEPRLGRVVADPSHLEQVILNLCVNARDAMPDGGTITVKTANAEVRQATPELAAGRYVLLAVKDNGHGIDPRIQSRIFEPFFTTKPGGKGTGLGLSTVFGIARQNGGAVIVRSEPGQGATFFVYLPRSEAPADPSGPHQTLRDDDGGDESVLLVEDHEELREMVTALLEARGYRVVAARDSRDALALLGARQEPFHLLITDVVMPVLNGRDLAAQATRLQPGLRVLYISGYTDEPFSPESGAAFLQKPFSSDALAHSVRTVLDAPRV